MRFLLTGYSDMEAVIAAVNKGEIHRYLTKPWNDEDLRLQVGHALKQVELIKENQRLTALTDQQNQKLTDLNASLESKVRERTLDVIRKHEALVAANKKLESGFMETVKLLSALVDTINPALGSYMRQTADLSKKVAIALGMEKEDENQVEIAALFHDIGMLGMPAAIVDRPEHKIKGKNFTLFSQHPVFASIGFEVNERLAAAAEIILHHHEQMDGRGFPNGLSGDNIPIGARIIAASSVYARITECWPQNPKRIMAKVTDYLGRAVASNLAVDDPQMMLAKIAEKILKAGTPRLYDPRIVNLILDIQREALNRKLGGTLTNVAFTDLQPQMVLMQDLRVKTGQLMLVKGSVLSKATINKIGKYLERDMISGKVKVLVKDD